MNLTPILPYITWGLVQNLQNKRGIPVLIKNSININNIRNIQKEEDISMIIHINIKHKIDKIQKEKKILLL